MSVPNCNPQMSFLLHLLLLVLAFSLITSGAPTTSGSPVSTTEVDSSSQSWATNSTALWDSTSASLTTLAPTQDTNETVTESPAPPLSEVTRNRQSTREGIVFISGGEGEDYYEDDDNGDSEEAITPFHPRAPEKPCQYDRCKHLEPPCEEIQRMAGGNCLCPGIAGSTVLPDTPRLGQIFPGENGASVRWCSPLSTVRGYKVLYGPPQGPLESGPVLNASYRIYSIGKLLPDTPYRVCVVAFNEAGESSTELREEEENMGWEGGKPGPCRIFRTTGSKGTQVYLGVGVGFAVLAGVLGLVVLGWWLWRRGKDRRRKEADAQDVGIPNLSYKSESVEQL